MKFVKVNADLSARAEIQKRANGQTCGQCQKLSPCGWCTIVASRRPKNAKVCAYGKRLIANDAVRRSLEKSKNYKHGRKVH